jgi:hypothetical protein
LSINRISGGDGGRKEEGWAAAATQSDNTKNSIGGVCKPLNTLGGSGSSSAARPMLLCTFTSILLVTKKLLINQPVKGVGCHWPGSFACVRLAQGRGGYHLSILLYILFEEAPPSRFLGPIGSFRAHAAISSCSS